RQEIGSDQLEKKHKRTGAGVVVALVDTGVTEVPDVSGRLVSVADPMASAVDLAGTAQVPCVNFSGEPDCADTFGHGTFMAGLIAGDGTSSKGTYKGAAPKARILSVKVGGRDGSADVSKVLAGIQWVVSFADTYKIKVLNLSLGTDSTAPTNVDPLNLAVQRAWVKGITVVVSAGNFGAERRVNTSGEYGTVTKPGDDPYVITVGAVDDIETTAITDDRLPNFTSWGPTAHGREKPDVVAPGGRLISLRASGSVIDGLPGAIDNNYRRGSGTSMSAAVVSGLAAQLLQGADASWTPDRVKAALMATAVPVASTDINAVGKGLVQGPQALTARVTFTPRTGTELGSAAGMGLLADSRGTVQTCLSDLLGCPLLLGEWTAQGRNWHGELYYTDSWTATGWYASQWVLDPTGRNWHTETWAGRNWHGAGWQGSTYDGGSADTRSYGEILPGSGSYGAWG
ncbi:MAG TPA: S8 family peptidase, partial [Egibacteraceae bacterium]|nr:S8 family peptidase [Egibacteraceae bacterium]